MWYSTTLKGIPKSERIIERYFKESFLVYIITIDNQKNYKLYFYKDDKAVFTKHKSNNPTNLEKYFKKLL